jgi:hypothetical protein
VLKYRVPHGSQPRPWWATNPLMVGIRSLDGLVVGLAPATLEFWVRFQMGGTGDNRATPCVKVPGSSRVPVHAPSRAPLLLPLLLKRVCCLLVLIPSFTQSPSPPRSLLRDGQTGPRRHGLVVSRSACPPISPSPLATTENLL